MSRGRRPKPAELKAVMGNPGKRHLVIGHDAGRGGSAPSTLKLEPPIKLTVEERKLFDWAIGSLPDNLVRPSDAVSFARWAAWMSVFKTCKDSLEGKQHWYTTSSEHSPQIHREHPLAKRMDKAEAHLIALDDRLCLNIVARNNVIHRLFNMPAAHASAFDFSGDVDPSETDKAPADVQVEDTGAIGFLDRAGKQFPTH